MTHRRLEPMGSWEITPRVFGDDRGIFFEAFSQPRIRQETGIDFTVAQANISVSKLGTVRGLHYADVPPGQAKFVQCIRGRVLDVLVDLRVGSATFGKWEALELDAEQHNAVHIPIGFGHAFQALSDDATVMYLCSTPYNPAGEHGIHPLDGDLALPWAVDLPRLLSEKDHAAPSWQSVVAAGGLPTLDACVAFEAFARD